LLIPRHTYAAHCLFLLIILLHGCVRAPERVKPLPTLTIAKTGVQIKSDKKEIIISYRWKKGDTSEHLFTILTPPLVHLKPVILDYSLEEGKSKEDSLNKTILKNINIAPEGFLRFNYFQSVRINPMLSRDITPPMEPLNPALKKVPQVLSSITLRLEFESPNRQPPIERPKMSRPGERGFSRILSVLVDNPEMAEEYAAQSPPVNLSTTDTLSIAYLPESIPREIPPLQLSVRNAGIYKIDSDLLAKSGIDPRRVNPRYFHISCAGREIPLATWGCFTSTFMKNDALLFYGYPPDCEYTDINIYRLYYDPKRPALRMETIGGEDIRDAVRPEYFISRLVIEEDKELKIHSGNFLSIKGMRWVWQEINPEKPFSCTFSLPGLKSIAGKGKVTLRIYCYPDDWTQPGRLQVQINDAPPQIFPIRNTTDDIKTFDIDYGILKENGNLLQCQILPEKPQTGQTRPTGRTGQTQSDTNPTSGTLVFPGGIFFDNLILEYPRQFLLDHGFLKIEKTPLKPGPTRYIIGNIPQSPIVGIEHSNPYKPRLILTKNAGLNRASFTTVESGESSYLFTVFDLVQSPLAVRHELNDNLSASSNAADYIIITHSDFISAAKKLVAYRERQGYKTRVVDVNAVYDEFNQGILSPIALKFFLATALLKWEIPPLYVVLFGDSTSDYKNESRNDIINYVPSYSYFSKFGEKDKWASDHWFTTLLGEDEYPDISLGRLSVNNVTDAENVVKKIIYYETKSSFGSWRTTLGYVADDGPFCEDTEDLRKNFTPTAFAGKTVYLEYLPLDDNFYLDQAFVERTKAKVSTVATAKILDLFQNGCLYMTYFGHGSPNIWADERIWFGGDSPNSDNLHLTNMEHLTFVTNMTCNSGAIDYPVPKWNICISEDSMRQPRGGSIAQFVPSGPGFTSAHKKISDSLHEALFKDHVATLGDTIILTRSLYLLRRNQVDIAQMFILLGDPALKLQIPAEVMPLQAYITDPETHAWKPWENERYLRLKDLPAKIRIIASPASFRRGMAIYSLYSPGNEISQDGAPVTFSGGSAYHEFTLPAGAMAGEWTAHCYLYNEGRKRDATGGITFNVGEPFLTLNNARAEKPLINISANTPLRLDAEVKDDSPIPCPDAAVDLINLVAENPSTRTLNQPIEPNETKTFSLEVNPKPGLNVFRFSTPAYFKPTNPETPTRNEILLPLVARDDSMTSTDLAISKYLMKRTYTQTGKRVNLSIVIPVFSLGIKSLDYADVILRNGTNTSGKVLRTSRISNITPRLPNNATIMMTLENPNEPQTFTLEAVPPKGENDIHPDNNKFTFVHDVSKLSDLSIDAHTIKLSEESPTEGRTVFFDVPVTNLGGAAAKNFHICLYDNDPDSGGKPLFDYTATPEKLITRLEAGETRTVRLRWDPIKNSGENKLFIKVDTANTVAEINKSNNTAIITIHVRTKANLKPLVIEIRQTDKEREALIAHLVARVRNDGETEAKNVSIRFFKEKSQAPDTLIGETLIPYIAPGEIGETDYVWHLTEEEAHFIYHPTFQAFLRGSSQRFSSVEEK